MCIREGYGRHRNYPVHSHLALSGIKFLLLYSSMRNTWKFVYESCATAALHVTVLTVFIGFARAL